MNTRSSPTHSGEGATATLNLCVVPEQLAVRGSDAERTLQSTPEVLLDAAELGGHDRGVDEGPLLGIGRAPDFVAGCFVERHHQGFAADRDDYPVGLDQRALAVVPGRNPGLVVPDQAFLPEFLPGLRVEAMENAFGVEREDVLAVHGGDGAGDAVIGTDALAFLETPKLRTVGQPEATDMPLTRLTVVVVEVHLAGVDGGGGIALADLGGPEELGAALRPLAQQAGLL